MPIVLTDYGPKPAQTLVNGTPSTMPRGGSPFLPGGRSITMTGDGWRTVSYANLYRSQPWLASPIRRLAEQMARLPLHIYQWLDAEGETRKRTRTHPAARLLSNPRPGRTGFHLRWEIGLSTYVHGNAVTWIRRNRSRVPIELWSLDWRLLVPYIDTGAYGFGLDAGSGPVIGWQWLGGGIPGLERGQWIDPNDVLHFAFAGPEGDVGVSPLEQLGVTIRAEDAVQRHTEAAFRNGMRPGMAAILDPKVKADEAKRAGIREELVDLHGGIDNTGKPAVLGGGITDLKPIEMQSAVDAELINQRKLNREECVAVLGLSGPLSGIPDEAKYSSLMEYHRILYVTTMAGPLGLVSETVQAQLLAEPIWNGDDLFAEFSLNEVLKGDAKVRYDAYGIAVDKGILTLNDVRRLENLEPYPDERANEPLIAANNVRPLSAVGTADDAGDAGKAIATAILGLVAQAKAIAAGDEVLELEAARALFAGELEGKAELAALNGQGDELVATLAELATTGGGA